MSRIHLTHLLNLMCTLGFTQSGGPGYIEPVEQVAGLGATPASTEGQQVRHSVKQHCDSGRCLIPVALCSPQCSFLSQHSCKCSFGRGEQPVLAVTRCILASGCKRESVAHGIAAFY